jgi:hypothetical protein
VGADAKKKPEALRGVAAKSSDASARAHEGARGGGAPRRPAGGARARGRGARCSAVP